MGRSSFFSYSFFCETASGEYFFYTDLLSSSSSTTSVVIYINDLAGNEFPHDLANERITSGSVAALSILCTSATNSTNVPNFYL